MINSVTKKEMDGYSLIEVSAIIEDIKGWKELDNLTSELVMSSQYNKVIVDERNVVHKQSILMVCELVENTIDKLPPDLKSIRIAVIVSEESKEIANFWETYSVNRGFTWRAFTNFDKALAFIKE